jgi:hypothetical protein
MRIYYRPRGSSVGVSFGAGWGLLWFLFALPLLLVFWFIAALWWLSGRIVGTDQQVARIILTAVMVGGIAALGSLLPEPTTIATTHVTGLGSSATLTNYEGARIKVTLLSYEANIKLTTPLSQAARMCS